MKSLKLKYYIAVNVSLILLGIILVLVGFGINDRIAKPILDALGIGLVAAGAVNVLDRSLTLEPPPPPPPPPVERIRVAAETRNAVPEYIFDKKYSSLKVDILGVSLNHCLEELINDPRQQIINRLLSHNTRLRLMLVHPAAKYLDQRAKEDREDIEELKMRQKRAVRLCVQFYRQLLDSYNSAVQNNSLNTKTTGSLEVKLLDFCPYITIFRVDDDIYWGNYTSATAGLNLPLFETSYEVDHLLYDDLKQHIYGLLEHDKTYGDLVTMSSVGKPWLNMPLAESILGKADLNSLLA